MIQLDDIHGWFGPENRAKLAELIERHGIRTVIEVGSFLGLSAGWFALHVEQVTCVDVWIDNPSVGIPLDCYGKFERNLRDLGVWDRIIPVRGNSREVHDRIAGADLVYIDGDHTYEGCKRDIELYGPKARKILCGDDYKEFDYYRVIQAVDQLLPERQVIGQFWWVLK